MTTAVPVPFDVGAALPGPGTTVLEASAGTGKTFTIAALVTRFVADGVPLSQVLAVTFTRMATGELRDRVRSRLVDSEAALGRHLDGGGSPAAEGAEVDEIVAALLDGPPEVVEARRIRLRTAVSAFDEATITTTHGFCQMMLSELGVLSGVPAEASLLEDPSDLVREVVDDLFVRRALGYGPPPFDRSMALEVAAAAVANPDTPLVPEPGTDRAGRNPAELRRRLADGVRIETTRRLRGADLLTYEDLLVGLRGTLTDERRGAAARTRLRNRYRVVLVDEFQDTDRTQWDVVRTAFGTGETVLVLIGDPKQAIYAFRGADVYAYLDAAGGAGRRFTLDQNWRSDEALLEALDAVLHPLLLGHERIPYRRVRATPAHRRSGLVGAPVRAALRVRVLHTGEHHGLRLTEKTQVVQKGEALRWIAEDLASDAVGLLGSGATLPHPPGPRSGGGDRPIEPGDLAVLVATNRQATIVHRALRAVGVPAVVAGTHSVFDTPAAGHWLRLLEALEQPASRSRAVAAALSPFLGMNGDDVAAAGDDVWEEVQTRLSQWSGILTGRGVAALWRTVSATEGLPGRIVGSAGRGSGGRGPGQGHGSAVPGHGGRDGGSGTGGGARGGDGGERTLTDLTHIGQLLHAESAGSGLGVPALRAWLARRMAEATPGSGPGDGGTEERSRRLDTDAEAVQVLTVHRSKGLEFPVVYCPFLWDPGWRPRRDGPIVFHDPGEGHRRTLDVGGRGHPGYRHHEAANLAEERGEDLRLLYVALTRARHQVVLSWARAHDCQHSPLGRLLLSREADGTVPARGGPTPSDDTVARRFADFAQQAPGRISVEHATGADGVSWEGSPGAAAARLCVAPFERTLDRCWRRSSYSAIVAGLHEQADPAGSDPEEPGITDEPAGAGAGAVGGGVPESTAADGATPMAGQPPSMGVASLLEAIPGGTATGTFVHHILERVDFTAPQLEQELSALIGGSLPDPSHAGILAAGLRAAIDTSLGPLVGGIALRDVSRRDRLDELGFELPLVGGDRPTGVLATDRIAELVDAHRGPGDPLAGYGRRLRDPLLATRLRGYLTGSLDLVLRVTRAGDDAARYFVLDYKTNRLGRWGEPLTTWDYRPDALDDEMQRAHYPLQALLYSVALHRYLRWRLPGYDPVHHLGGVLYLFVRGMVGPDTPMIDGHPCGVFSWRPAPALVSDLSNLFDTGRTASAGVG